MSKSSQEPSFCGTASLQDFWHPGWCCDIKFYNESAIKLCFGTSLGARTFGIRLYRTKVF